MARMHVAALVACVAVVVLALALEAKRPKHMELSDYSFERFIKDFAKPHVKGTVEYEQRRALFEVELQAVREHNAVAGALWKKGINKMSDFTVAEKKHMNGLIAAMKPLSETKALRTHRVSNANAAPYAFDWRAVEPRVLTSVKDQGNCGSCWAHAAVETIETAVAQSTGQLFVLSQQQIASCTPNPKECGGTGGCAGGIAELAIDYIASVGISEEWVSPYMSYFNVTPTCSATAGQAQTTAITGYVQVTSNDGAALLDALATTAPLAITVDASMWSNYEAGVFAGCSYAKNISMDHGVMAVGFGFDFDLGVNYWIVRNSWSAAWGENGYIRVLRAATGTSEACGWNVFPQNGVGCKGQTAPQWACGMCGIAFDPLYATTN